MTDEELWEDYKTVCLQRNALALKLAAAEQVVEAARELRAHESTEPGGPGGGWHDWEVEHLVLIERLYAALATYDNGATSD